MSKALIDSNFEIKTKYLWHSTQVYCLSFDRTGKFIFTGGDDGLVKIYSLSKDRLVKCLSDESETEFAEEVENICRDIDFSKDFKPETSLETQTEKFAVCDIAVNYENTLIAAAKHSGSIPVWNLQTFQLVVKLEEQVFPIRAIKFSPMVFDESSKYLISTSEDGFMFFYAYDQNSLQFSPKSLHRRGKYDGERAHNICCDNSAGGLLIGAIHTFGVKTELSKPKSKKAPFVRNELQSAIRVFSLSDELGPKEEWKTTYHKSHAECEYSFRFCHNSFRFATGCDKDSNAFVWTFDKSNKKWDSIIIDINTKGDKKILRGKSKQSVDSVFVDEIIFSCADAHVITNLTDYTIKVWNSETGELVQHFDKHHSDKISTIECHPIVDHIFMSAAYDSKVFIYDITNGSVLKKFDCSLKVNTMSNNDEFAKVLLLQCSFSPDGQTVAATDNFGNLSVFSSESQNESNSLDHLEEELKRIHAECDVDDDLLVPKITTSDKDLNLINSMFEYESDLLKGIEKHSPTKYLQTNDEKKIVVKKLDLDKELTNETKAKKTPVLPNKGKATKKKTPIKPTVIKSVSVETKQEMNNSLETNGSEEIPEPTAKPKKSVATKQSKLGKHAFTQILNEIFENPNSTPFQINDHILYPTYRKEISDADISLSSIREDLVTSVKGYGFQWFNKNMNTVFENAKKFFKHRDEEIYEMALTLEKYYSNKMETQFGKLFRPPRDVDTSDEESDVEVVEQKASTSKPTKEDSIETQKKANVEKRTVRSAVPLREKSTRNKPKSAEDVEKPSPETTERIEIKANSETKEVIKERKRKTNSKPKTGKKSNKNKRLKTNSNESTNSGQSVDNNADNESDITANTSSQKSKNSKNDPELESIDLEPKGLNSYFFDFEEEVEAEEEDEEVIEKTGTEESVDNSEAVINGNVVPNHTNSCDIQKQSSDLKNSLFCIFCDKIFWDKTEATAHYVLHLCPLKCVKCELCFSTFDQYLSHSCGSAKRPENIEWCRHYSDSIVWIDNFLEFQKTEEIESFEPIVERIHNCIVCEKVQQFRAESNYTVREVKTYSYESHLEKHLKYISQFQCLICFLKEDKYFYCKNSVEAEIHLKKEHTDYDYSDSSALKYFDGSIPKLDEIVKQFYE